MSRTLIEKAMDLPDGVHIAHVYVPDDLATPPEWRDVRVVLVGPGMPEVEPGLMPPRVRLVYERRDPEMFANAKLVYVECVRSV